MRKYIKADFIRIFKRVPRIILLAAAFLGCAVISAVTNCHSLREAVENVNTSFSIMALLAGIIEIVFIYGDDFKAKTMQIAIGCGIARQKIVHAKWLEFMLAMALNELVYGVIALIACVIIRGTEGGFNVGNFMVCLIMGWVSAIAFLGSVMFIMFWTQGISLTLICYICASMSVFSTYVIPLAAKALKLTRFHLHTYLLESMLSTVQARLLLGHLSIPNAIGILLYMVVGFALASILFAKKELEF